MSHPTPPRVPRFGVALLCGALGFLARAALAGELPAGSSGLGAREGAGAPESHAWVVAPAPGGLGGAVVLHVPPRGAVIDPGGRLGQGAPDGTIQVAGRLAEMPEWVAAWGRRVFLAFGPRVAGGPRTVLSLSCERSGLADRWIYDSEGRRPTVLPSLPAAANLLGFVGMEGGPLALARGADGDPAPRLLYLRGDDWEDLDLPDLGGHAAGRDGWALMPLGEGVGLYNLAVDPPGWWQGRHVGNDARTDGPSAPTMAWEFSALRLPEEFGASESAGTRLISFDSGFVGVSLAGAEIEVWRLTAEDPRPIARLPVHGEHHAIVALGQGQGRLVLLQAGQAVGGGGTRTQFELTEVAALSGTVLFNGPARAGGPISAVEMRVLALLLVCAMVLVLLFVLRPEARRAEVSLPRGFALAEPGRRTVATLIDCLPGLAVGLRVADVGPVGVEGLLALLAGRDLLVVLGVCGLVGLAHAAVSEALFGRSLGKALTGSVVVVPRLERNPDGTVQPVLVRPGFWRSVARNLVKWLVAPLAVVGLLSAGGRHLGDLLAGTLVVVRVDVGHAPEAAPASDERGGPGPE